METHFQKGNPENEYIRCLCRLIDKTVICAVKRDDVKRHESTIKTAAPRGAPRAFCNYVSVDAMFSIQYDDRGLVSRCGYCIRCVLFIAPCCELHSCRTDGEDPEE